MRLFSGICMDDLVLVDEKPPVSSQKSAGRARPSGLVVAVWPPQVLPPGESVRWIILLEVAAAVVVAVVVVELCGAVRVKQGDGG